jgi:hypothetical protein
MHLVREGHLDKAYMLNRFRIYLLAACVRTLDSSAGQDMRLTLHFRAGQALRRQVQQAAGVRIA